MYVILGVQGSGTNMLARLLTRLFGFSVVQDQSLVVRAASMLPPSPSASDIARQFDAIASFMFPTVWTRKLRRRMFPRNERFDGIREHFAASTIRSPADLVSFVYAYRAFVRGERRLAVKSDDIWAYASALDRVLPNRRVILLTRDFRDNAVSITGKPFGPVEPLLAARFVKRRFACYQAEYNRAAGPAVHVRYEDVIRTPAEVFDRIAQRFSLLSAGALDEQLATFAFRANRVGRWAELSPRDLELCETVLHDELVQYGYDPATSARLKPRPGELTLIAARDAVGRIPQKLRGVVARLRQ